MIAILLAAGFSRRFGDANKLMQPLADGRAMALVAAQNLVAAIPNTFVMIRPENIELAALLKEAGLQVLTCAEPKQSMAESLSMAIMLASEISEPTIGFVIALADMPYIRPETITAVANKLHAGANIVVPTYQQQRGHPVAFAAKYKDELQNVQGDEGGRSLIKHYQSEVQLLACDDAGILADIDTPEDF